MLEDMTFLPSGIKTLMINETVPIIPGECRVRLEREGDAWYFSIYKYNSMNLEDITYIDERECVDFLIEEKPADNWHNFYNWVTSRIGGAGVKFFKDVILMFDPYDDERLY